MGSYINSTSPHPFHQLIAISQKTINKSYEYMWNQAQLDDDPNPLQHFKIAMYGNKIDTDVGIPSVELQVTGSDPQLYFMFRMTKGKLRLVIDAEDDAEANNRKRVRMQERLREDDDDDHDAGDGEVQADWDDDDDEIIKWDIKDWKFAFSVTIKRKEVVKDSEDYLDYKRRAGLPNSDFSLARLFIDTSSTTKWNPELSDFGDHQKDWEALDDDGKDTFMFFVNKWLRKMQKAKKDLIGYSALRNESNPDLNKYVPSFPPTSIDYATYPWPNPPGKDNDDMTALCYLMMSDFKTPPIRGDIAYSGQFVDQDHDATFVMSHKLFWDGWMFSVLQKLIRGLIIVPLEPIAEWVNEDPNAPYYADVNYVIGDSNTNPSLYNFARNGSGGWDWIGRPFHMQKKAWKPGNAREDWEFVDQWCMMPHKNAYDMRNPFHGGSLSFSPGGDRLTLTGDYDFSFDINHNDKKYYDMTFHVSFVVTLGVASVTKGGLRFETVGDNHIKVTSSSGGDLHFNGNPEARAERLRQQLEFNITKAFESVEQELLYALANHHRLFLPGYGCYLYKDAVFNKNGDLMVRLSYDGADPPSA